MKNSKQFFEKCKVDWWSGYYIPVRNRWSMALKRKHLTNVQMENYKQQFGEQILYHDDFEDWLLRTNDYLV